MGDIIYHQYVLEPLLIIEIVQNMKVIFNIYMIINCVQPGDQCIQFLFNIKRTSNPFLVLLEV